MFNDSCWWLLSKSSSMAQPATPEAGGGQARGGCQSRAQCRGTLAGSPPGLAPAREADTRSMLTTTAKKTLNLEKCTKGAWRQQQKLHVIPVRCIKLLASFGKKR